MTTLRAQCWIQIEVPDNTPRDQYEDSFNAALDRFRGAVLPATDHGVLIYRSRKEGWIEWSDLETVEEV